MSLEPAVAALLAYLLIGEALTPVQWLAIGLIISASAGITANAPSGCGRAYFPARTRDATLMYLRPASWA